MMKKILFITGTRADYGKLKSLMQELEKDAQFEVDIFVCGMHLLPGFGNTYKEILKDGFKNVHVAREIEVSKNYSSNVGNSILALGRYVDEIQPNMIIVHGDRMDALMGAIVGVLNNILVAHIEGGELSGTMDESIRHAISKFAHIHFVCTNEAKKRLIQMGEESSRIFVIGSPDIDVMVSDTLPLLDKAKERYNISFSHYGILIYHSVTTELKKLNDNIREVVSGIIDSQKNFVVIYPNNDMGADVVLREYKRFNNNKRFRIFPSIRFEYFLTLLKNADVIIGNSSAGIRESGIYGVPAIDIGTRQNKRYDTSICKNIQHVSESSKEIVSALNNIGFYKVATTCFGQGNSMEKFMSILKQDCFWNIKLQKYFVDFKM